MSKPLDHNGQIASHVATVMHLSMQGFHQTTVYESRKDAATFFLEALKAGMREAKDCKPELIKVVWSNDGKLVELSLEEFMAQLLTFAMLFSAITGLKVPMHIDIIEEVLTKYEEI